MLEEAAISVLDAEIQRKFSWWDADGADTCALFCSWMQQVLAEAEEERKHQAMDIEGTKEALRSKLARMTRRLHPVSSEPSPEADWEELRENLPEEGKELLKRMREEEPAVDLPRTWHQLQLNQIGCYSLTEHVGGGYERVWRFLTSSSLLPLTSVGFNHSCSPNLLRLCIGPIVLFRSSRSIRAGEQLTISYVGTDQLRCSVCLKEEEEEEEEAQEIVTELPVSLRAQISLATAEERIEMIEQSILDGSAFKVEAEGSVNEEIKARVRLQHRDEMELMIQMGLAELELKHWRRATDTFLRARVRAKKRWLPADARDEVFVSFLLLSLVGRVAEQLEEESEGDTEKDQRWQRLLITHAGLVVGMVEEEEEGEGIPRLHVKDLPPEMFWEEFMMKNRPVMIEGLTEGWEIVRWVSDGQLRTDRLRESYGKEEVCVHNCRKKVQVCHADAPTPMTRGKDWNLAKLEEMKRKADEREGGQQEVEESKQMTKRIYKCPEHFEEDWLNRYERNFASDHRFVYVGPAGSFTPFHKDTLNSFSWSSNICGCKRWWMLPPEYEQETLDGEGKEHIFDVREEEGEKHCRFVLARPRITTFLQRAGDTIFVPSGWWHQVENVEDTVSVNHNWVNASNVSWSWELLKEEAERRRKELGEQDCKGVVQEVLEFRLGWNFRSFLVFLRECLELEVEQARRLLLLPVDNKDGLACGRRKLRLHGLERLLAILPEVARMLGEEEEEGGRMEEANKLLVSLSSQQK
ncbi:hypothetical protein GUITHDRAFT_141117 [Guillardia theta CCMP2712]|uniref:JmjC domain-containing protein n=1 Tax=Guillardia theta (strain CCMP2712) TaxID=905079 RepID=L1J3Q8_GUITC|nr:hypothetical protein GUITHDRAFT_141117 [Guillardia theta CCMP2712]EKX42725.1 hypothetical protein GUITHDRAFT_141117 [Guillardia theta CCMP2712]|eukprot:XP_005829705.1 hypothetical protein GUITHDRAFT_141117 [Guillardia theta CCMP2712]